MASGAIKALPVPGTMCVVHAAKAKISFGTSKIATQGKTYNNRHIFNKLPKAESRR